MKPVISYNTDEQINLIDLAQSISDKRLYLRGNRKKVGWFNRRKLTKEIHILVNQYNKIVGFKAIKF